MEEKEHYKTLCERDPTIPLFSCDWWLDSVAGARAWDVALVTNGECVAAAMPYVLKKRYTFKLIKMPLLTQVMGPWLAPINAKYANQLVRQKELMGELINQLPKFDYFAQNWHYSQTNWLPFYWSGFKQTTRYTYVIEGLGDLDRVFSGFSSSYRNKIRKADRLVEIKSDLDVDSFYRINCMTFHRQNLTPRYPLEFVRRHDAVLAKKGQRKIFYAIDDQSVIHSALYLVWDKMSSYVHMVGEDPNLRSSGAGIRLIWEAVVYTSQVLGLDKLDFEGSMIENVERVRRDCGAKQMPYFSVTKVPSRLLRARSCLSDIIGRR